MLNYFNKDSIGLLTLVMVIAAGCARDKSRNGQELHKPQNAGEKIEVLMGVSPEDQELFDEGDGTTYLSPQFKSTKKSSEIASVKAKICVKWLAAEKAKVVDNQSGIISVSYLEGHTYDRLGSPQVCTKYEEVSIPSSESFLEMIQHHSKLMAAINYDQLSKKDADMEEKIVAAEKKFDQRSIVESVKRRVIKDLINRDIEGLIKQKLIKEFESK